MNLKTLYEDTAYIFAIILHCNFILCCSLSSHLNLSFLFSFLFNSSQFIYIKKSSTLLQLLYLHFETKRLNTQDTEFILMESHGPKGFWDLHESVPSGHANGSIENDSYRHSFGKISNFIETDLLLYKFI